MKLRHYTEGPLFCPVVICDVCDEPIDNGAGLVIWPAVGRLEEHKCVHKGRCDISHYSCSNELDAFLQMLINNYQDPVPRKGLVSIERGC